MDPVSLLFTAYLDSIQNTVHARFTDLYGTEIKAVMIDYQSEGVPYQCAPWRVRDKSLRQSYKSQTTKFSECTLATKALFRDLWAQLSDKSSNHWRYSKLKNMYCNPAASFETNFFRFGVVALPTRDEVTRAIFACSILTLSISKN